MFDIGSGVPKNYVEAVAWLRIAAELGYSDAERSLGSHYLEGQGVGKDVDKGLAWYLRAVQQGDLWAAYWLAMHYESGDGVLKDPAEALRWLKTAAEGGLTFAQYALGQHYASGNLVPRDESVALSWYRKAAEQGLSTAQIEIGDCYRQGRGTAPNVEQAVTWYRQAAEEGDSAGQVQLGWQYEVGQGVSQDYKTAAAWYLNAAAQGDVDGEYDLANLYGSGEGVPHDDREAVRWFGLAAEKEDADSLFRLAGFYETGSVVPKDLAQAVACLRDAADRGNLYAQYELGDFYENGRGVPQDLRQTEKWMRKAADGGYAEAQYWLGRAYESGTGVPKDLRLASSWLQKAADQGHEQARTELQRVSARPQIPFAYPGTWFDGVVSSVTNDVITLALGAVTIDASQASITLADAGKPGSIASIHPGDSVAGIYDDLPIAPGDPLPALWIGVSERILATPADLVKTPVATFGGRTQSVSPSSVTVAGRTLTIGPATVYSEYVHTISEIHRGTQIAVTAAASNPTVAADICGSCYGPPSDVSWLNGFVKATGGSWIVCDNVDHEFEIRVSGDTRIVGGPRTGDTVDVIVHPATGDAEWIRTSGEPIGFFIETLADRGIVKSISDTELRIGSSDGLVAQDRLVKLSPQVNVVGAPKPGDVVDLWGVSWNMLIVKTPRLLHPVTLHGALDGVPPWQNKDGRLIPCEEARITPCGWGLRTPGVLYNFYSTAQTKINRDVLSRSPSAVVVTLLPTADGYIAESIDPEPQP